MFQSKQKTSVLFRRYLVWFGIAQAFVMVLVVALVAYLNVSQTARGRLVNVSQEQAMKFEKQIAALEENLKKLASDPEFSIAQNNLWATLEPTEAVLGPAYETNQNRVEAELTRLYSNFLKKESSQDAADKILQAPKVARILQYQYVLANPYQGKDRANWIDTGDGSAYSLWHREWQPKLLEMAKQYNFEDVLLVRGSDGLVFYSLLKTPYFGQSLKDETLLKGNLGKTWESLQDRRADFRFVEPDENGFDDKPMISAIVRMSDDSYLVARWPVASLMKASLQEALPGVNSFVVGADQKLRWSSVATFASKNFDLLSLLNKLKSEEPIRMSNLNGQQVLATITPVSLGTIPWLMVTQWPFTSIFKPWIIGAGLLLLISLSLTVVAAVLVPVVFKQSRDQIAELVESLKNLVEEDGDLTARVSLKDQNDLEDLANWVNVLLEKIEYKISHVLQQARDFREKSLEVSVEMKKLADETAAKIPTYQAVQNLLNAHGETVNSLDAIAISTEERFDRTNELLSESLDLSKQMDHQTKKVYDSLATLLQLTDRAQQAALHSSIELSRLGDQGRPFLVVVDELKDVAEKGGVLGRDLNLMVRDNREVYQKQVVALERCGLHLKDLSEECRQLLGMVHDVRSRAESQVNLIRQETQQMTPNLESLNTLVRFASDVSLKAEGLKKIMERFKVSDMVNA